MYAFVQFSEAYMELIVRVCRELKQRVPGGDLRFRGIAIRRKTVCPMVDRVADELGVETCEWWNDVERRILDGPPDPSRIAHYREVFGDRRLRHLVACDRELGYGFVTGGRYARTPLRRRVESHGEARWQYVAGVLDYYHGLFERERPLFVFLNEITFTWELALYLTAEHLGIPCYVPCYTRSGKGFIITDNPWQRCDHIDSLYRRALENPALLAEERPEAARILAEFRDRPAPLEYSQESLKALRRQASIPGMLQQFGTDVLKSIASKCGLFGTRGFLRQENWNDVTAANLGRFRMARRALRGKDFEPAEPHLGHDFIFYPLHVEPESSTLILSEPLTNQLVYIEQIAKQMPVGYRLLVKEHVPVLGTRPRGFYERIRSMPDVHLISPFADNFRLIQQARVVCVLTGTAGWEAIQLGTPVIVVGEAQYLGIGGGFIRCTNLFTLDRDIARAVEMPPVPGDHLELYIAAALRLQSDINFRAFLYWHYRYNPDEVIPQRGIEQLADQILRGLEARGALPASAELA